MCAFTVLLTQKRKKTSLCPILQTFMSVCVNFSTQLQISGVTHFVYCVQDLFYIFIRLPQNTTFLQHYICLFWLTLFLSIYLLKCLVYTAVTLKSFLISLFCGVFFCSLHVWPIHFTSFLWTWNIIFVKSHLYYINKSIMKLVQFP